MRWGAIVRGRIDATRCSRAPITLTVLPDLRQVEALLDGEDGLLAGWQASLRSAVPIV